MHICPTTVCPTHINLSYTNLPNDSISTCLKKRVNINKTGVEITCYFVINSEQQLHDFEILKVYKTFNVLPTITNMVCLFGMIMPCRK